MIWKIVEKTRCIFCGKRKIFSVAIAGFLISCLDTRFRLPEVITQPPQISESTTQLPIEFIGEARLPVGLMYQNTEFGGLSGITYDEENQVYYVISDDRSQKAAARFYTVKLEWSPVKVLPEIGVTILFDESNQTFAPGQLDPEAIRLTDRNTVWITSEGDRARNISPFIKEFSLDGKQLKSLSIPQKLLSDRNNRLGIRNNLSLESLAISPDNNWLLTATENALIQDGLPADLHQGSPCRIIKYNLTTGEPETEFLYVTESVADPPNPPDSFHTNGLVELLAIDETHLLAVERSYSNGVGNTILLFDVSLENASNIQTIERLSEADIGDIKPAEKRLLFDLRSLNIPLDNIEGMTFGPTLADGRRSLILISDNNFNPLQVTQILVFAMTQP